MEYNRWTPKQVEAYHSTRQYLYTLFGGAKGGGKSVGGTKIYQCDISNYRSGVFVVMRKNYTVLRNTTMRTFEKFFDPALILHKSNTKWYCVNNNQIWFWAADPSRDPNLEKTRGLEVTEIMVDEASEDSVELYEILPSLLRQPAVSIDDQEDWIGNIYMTSNPVPGRNYLKDKFIDPRTRVRDGRHNFIQSLPDDNPLLQDGYISKAFDNMNDTLRRMLRYGDWNVEEADFQIVPPAYSREICWSDIVRGRIRAAGIDIGLGRPDLTVVWACDENGHFHRFMAVGEYDTMRQATLLRPICDEVRNSNGEVWIDASSVGKGVADKLLSEFGPDTIVPVSFGQSPLEEESKQQMPYENLRAQLYFWSREDISHAAGQSCNGDVPDITMDYCEQLIEEFENTFYLPKDGKLRIEPKENVKERIGRSPDDADAWVLCNAARRAVKNRPVYLGRGTRERKSRSSIITAGY